LACRRPADRARRLEAVGRTGRAGAVAGLRDVADPRRRATGGAGIARWVLARHAGAVALIERAGVAVGGAPGPGRGPRIGRAVRTCARAVLRRVARAGGGATDRARGLEGVGGARRARPRAVLRHVAGAGRGATLGRR